MQITDIKDFKSKISLLDLQNRFYKQTYLNDILPFGVPDFIEIQKEDFFIEYQVVEQFTSGGYIDGTKLVKYWFYKDYLKSQIAYLAENYNAKTIDFINRNCLAEVNDRKNHILYERQEISKILLNFSQFDFLEPELYEAIRNQIIKSEKDIHSNTLLTDKIFGIGKIEFLTNEQDLISLMYFLRKNKFINNYTDTQLGRLIESNFCVKIDNESSKDLDRVGKRLNDLKNGNDSVQKSITRLIKAFDKNDFFEI